MRAAETGRILVDLSTMTADFSEFTDSNHAENHLDTSSMASCRRTVSRVGDLSMQYMDVSSANRFTDFALGDRLSFMYTVNGSGLRMAPWGTPAWRVANSDVMPSTVTA